MAHLAKNSGIAILEFAVAATFLLFLVTGAVGLLDYVRHVRSINDTLENALIDDGIKPLTLSLGEAGSTISLRTSALENYLGGVVSKTREHLVPLIEDGGQGTAGLYIEAGYAEVEINTTSGAFTGIHPIVIPEGARFGDLAIPASLARQTDIGEEFLRLANERTTDGGVSALYAIPTGLFGGQNADHHFLGKSVLVGIRAFLTLKGGLAGRFMPRVGDSPVVFGIKAIALRGELE